MSRPGSIFIPESGNAYIVEDYEGEEFEEGEGEGEEEEEDEDEEEEDWSEEDTDEGGDEVTYTGWPDLSGAAGTTTPSQDDVRGLDNTEETTSDVGASQSAKSVEKLAGVKDDDSAGEREEWDRSEVDGLFCPICMEAWSSGGNHQICCLPCGHVYGMSCIKKWLDQKKRSGKCPQCNKKCTVRDVRLLYVSQLLAVDEKLQKKIQSLEAKCSSLEKKCVEWSKKETQWQRTEANLQMQIRQLKESKTNVDVWPIEMENKPSKWHIPGSCNYGWHGHFNYFSLKEEMKMEGARFFDMDVSGQVLIIARRLSGMGGIHVLTKMSLLSQHEKQDIVLLPSTKAVKDIHISPYDRLVLVASLGKKLSVLSTESNNTVLTYDLPTAAWSCSWDVNNPCYIYAGLQNGMVMEFDRRQTMRHVECINGFAVNPIHTMHSILTQPESSSGSRRSILSASSVGLCQWNFGCNEERPHIIPQSDNHGVCISLAYAPSTSDIVASFRPKVVMSGDIGVAASQTMLSPSSSLTEQAVQGSHVVYRIQSNNYHKVGVSCANVSSIRLPKSTIIESDTTEKALFACGDEASCELVLQELPSLKDVMRVQAPRNPVRDVKYTNALGSGLLSCLRQDSVQLFLSKAS
ncbi:unnamed protein product [Cuscuta campestris]|uniref:RING-type E3 ubiquitin transferase n=1 Tax=Cuscuta campestris TaxID=132261 RepID=A0A484NLA0_9ASTE|nr:unnamed protein product [Cuscuta campestris]